MRLKIHQIATTAVLSAVIFVVSGAMGFTPPVDSRPLSPAKKQHVTKVDVYQIADTEKEITGVAEERLGKSTVNFSQFCSGSFSVVAEDDMIYDGTVIAVYKEGKTDNRTFLRKNRRNAAKAPQLPVNNEKFFSADKVYGTADINTYTITFSVSGTTTKTYKVKGVYGQTSSTLNVTFDNDGNAVIAAQKYLNNTTYGNIWFCPVDPVAGTYSLTDPVVCTRDEEGNWEMGAWALVVNHTTDKGYNGSVLFVSEHTRWLVPNMTASFKTTDASGNTKDNTFQCAWYQDDPSGLYLLNMGNTVYGRAVNVRLTPQHRGVLSPQFVSSAGGYGNLYAYYADYATGQASPSKSATCNVTDGNALVFTDLIIATRNISNSINIRIAASPITYTLGGEAVRFPEPVSVGFSGSGTPGDPYLISRAEDIRAMSAAMSQPGYSTAFYKLMNDIDLSSLTTFQPIGDDAVPFNGNFNGNSKTLKGLKYNGYGFGFTGLFGVSGPQSEIYDLNIDGWSVYSAGANTGIVTAYNMGTVRRIRVSNSLLQTRSEVAGGIAGMNTGLITGCEVKGEILGYGANGGMTGYNCGEIADCHFSGQMAMEGALSTSYRHIAGIAAQALSSASSGLKSNIHDCTVSGLITDNTGYAYLGGVVGVSHGSKAEDPSVIERCVNTATLSSTGLDWNSDNTLPKSYCGGVAAYISSTRINDCANGGLIIETSLPKVFTGGVVGIASVSFISSGSDGRLGNVSSVERSLSVGQIYSTSGAGCGIYGGVPEIGGYESDEIAAIVFKNCYADDQINLLSDDRYAVSTTELVSGVLPTGLSSSIWSAGAGFYPVPATVKTTDAGVLLSASAVFAAGENYTNVKKNFNVNGASATKWGILGNGGNIIEQSPSLAISENTATIGKEYGNNWLVARQGASEKMIMVCIVPKIFDGEGTSESPFLIKNISDMAILNKAVVEYGQSHLGDHFRMTADIDASADPSFVCIGYPAMTRPFNGIFDGDNHSFHKLAVKTAFRTSSGGVTASKSYQYSGLFSFIGTEGVVRNVVIADDCEYDVYNMSGSIAGLNNGLIEGCRNYAAIGANGMATGGIAGENNGRISACYNGATITMQQNAVKTGAGGIAGANTGLIELCQNAGDVTIAKGKTSEVFGGITAINYGKIDRCINQGAVTANVKAGGITGILGSYTETGEISRSASFGVVTTVKDATNGAVVNEIRNNKVSDMVYDSSISSVGASLNPLTGCVPMSTHDLVDGKAPACIPEEILDLKAGKYPVLKIFAGEAKVELLRSTYIDFTVGQSVSNVGSDVDLSKVQDVVWTVSESPSFSIAEGVLKVTVPEGDMGAKAVVNASKGDDVVKSYAIVSLPVLFEGKGTSESPYLIKTKEDLNTLSSFIAKNAYDCLNKHYLLVSDIAYSDGDTFAPLGGDGTTKFNGKFDGNNKKISGIVYSNTVAKPGKNTGVFGQVGPQGLIHDLAVNNTFTGYGAGGVAAQLEGEIYNCINSGAIAATGDPAGGIVGTLKAGGRIHDCDNLGTVMSAKTYGTGGIVGKSEAGSEIFRCINKGRLGDETQGKIIGGIAGLAAGSVTGCRNEGVLTSASASVGGIIGRHLSGALLDITDCHNTATVYAPKAISVAGILGGNDSDKSLNKAKVHIKDCGNSGAITGTLGVGGIIGIVSESDFTMEGCVNSAAIEALNLGDKKNADTFVGGIAGCSNGATVEGASQYIRNCVNTGNVTAWGGQCIGGLTGKNGVLVSGCRNTGNVKAIFDATGLADLSGFTLSDIGGISGCAYGVIEKCWNSGSVTTDGCWVGGITGYTNKDITGCANIGDITGKAGAIPGGSDTQAVAGIVGRMGTISYPGIIADCYNTGDITGLTQVAGIVAQRFGAEAQLENVYNTGKVVATAVGGAAFAVGNMRTDGASVLPVSANVYYLKGCCVAGSDLDRSAKEVEIDALSDAALGNGYINASGATPVLADLYEPAYTYFDAVYGLKFGRGDTAQSVTGNIGYAALPGLLWTSSDNLRISDGVAAPVANGEGWLRVAIDGKDDSFKKYDVRITGASGISEIGDGASKILSEEYYDLHGFPVTRPEKGKVYVVKRMFENGTVTSERMIAK